MSYRTILIATGLLLPVFYIQAAESTPPTAQQEQTKSQTGSGKWQGGAELGFVTTSGNTDTQSVNAKLTVEYLIDKWKHSFRGNTLRSEDSGTVTADNLSLLLRSQYNFAKKEYMFGSLRYEEDTFSGFDNRTTEVIGYGHQFYDTESFKLSAEVGVGARQTDLTDGTTQDDGIVRIASDIEWKITETSSITEALLVDIGGDNTYTESVTGLKVKINASLALKLTATIKDNSDVPAGKKHTDTQTAVTLVYDF